jgi:hypothetical protein
MSGIAAVEKVLSLRIFDVTAGLPAGKYKPRRFGMGRRFPRGPAVEDGPVIGGNGGGPFGGLHAAFDFKGIDPDVPQAPYVLSGGEVVAGKIISPPREDRRRVLGVCFEPSPADLGAFAPVAGPPEKKARSETEAGKGIAEGSVNKNLEFHIGVGGPDAGDFLQGKFAGQYDPADPEGF